MYISGRGRFDGPAPDTEFRDLAKCFPDVILPNTLISRDRVKQCFCLVLVLVSFCFEGFCKFVMSFDTFL